MIALLGLSSCSASTSSKQVSDGQAGVSVPAHLHDIDERRDYIVQHYWDTIDLRDSVLLQDNSGRLEALFIDYFGLISTMDDEALAKAAVAPLNEMQGESLLRVLRIYREYLFEPSSPLEDERAFRAVLEWAITSPRVDFAYQEQARELLRVINLNRVGTPATDFIYDTPEGTRHRLSTVLSPLTVVIFGTRGCPTCRMTLDYIKGEPIYRQLAERDQLRLLYIYVQDDEALPLQPVDSTALWISTGRDHEGRIIHDQLYDIKASPTLYLLDRDKRVLMKSAQLPDLTHYLEQVQTR